jgi:hypothetical protein
MAHILRRASRRVYEVYFVEAVGTGRVKIGIAEHFERRLASLRCGSPVDLNVLLVIPGRARHEHALHRAFASERSHGEWFALSERLRALISELAACDRAGALRRLSMLDKETPAIPPRVGIYAAQIAAGERRSPVSSKADRHRLAETLTAGARSAQRERSRRLWRALDELLTGEKVAA